MLKWLATATPPAAAPLLLQPQPLLQILKLPYGQLHQHLS
jgi:hypothetical protein